MEIAKLILEFIRVLLWPIIIIILIIKYNKHLTKLIKRLVEDSDEISSSFLGLNAKFRKEILDASNDNKTSNEQLRQILVDKASKNIRDELRILASNFRSDSTKERKNIADEIIKISGGLPLDVIAEFTKSALPGERMAGFAALGKFVSTLDAQVLENKDIIDSLQSGLDDYDSLVRYRAVQAIGRNRNLVDFFRNKLALHFNKESNPAVRTRIKKILGLRSN